MFTLTVHHGPFLLGVSTGEGGIADALSALDFMARVSREQEYRRVLLDLMSVKFNLTLADQQAVGLHAAEVLGHINRFAIAGSSSFRLVEGDAWPAGLRLETFTDIATAMHWIAVCHNPPRC